RSARRSMANENCASHELKYRNRGQAAWELRKGQVFAASSVRQGPNIKPIGKRERGASDARRLCAVAVSPPSIDMTSSLSTATNPASWVARSPTERKVSSQTDSWQRMPFASGGTLCAYSFLLFDQVVIAVTDSLSVAP